MNKSTEKANGSLWWLVPAFFAAISVFSASCKITAEGVVSASQGVESPVLSDFSQISTERLSLTFSKKVCLSDLKVRSGNPARMGELILPSDGIRVEEEPAGGADHTAAAADGSSQSLSAKFQIVFTDSDRLEPGAAYVFSGVAQDEEGNSLLFRVPFHGFNRNVAGVVLSEVRAGYGKPKVEFIEFYVHTSGNLAGIALSAANKDFEYVFPSAEVSAGEYIVLHMRTLEQESGHVDELDNNLDASVAPDSCTNARDLWVPLSARIVGTSDVIVLQERLNGKIVDALLYAHPEMSGTVEKKIVPVAQKVVDSGAWQGSAEIGDWALAEGLTNDSTTRSLSRQNIAEIDGAVKAGLPIPVNNRDNWFVTKTVGKASGATPGLANSTNKYTK